MKIGIFDSGLGGLLVARSVRAQLPSYDYVYFGDTLHVPYGGKSQDAIYQYCLKAMDFLFEQQDCALIIIACNTANAACLRRLQQEYLSAHYPDRRILGVIVPMLEAATQSPARRIGVIGTQYMMRSSIYVEELQKLRPDVQIFQNAAPLLVPLIENSGRDFAPPIIEHYLQPLLVQNIDSLILGCTHYAYFMDLIQVACGPNVTILSQDQIVPDKLADYLNRHSETDQKISRHGQFECYLSDITPFYTGNVNALMGNEIVIHKAA